MPTSLANLREEEDLELNRAEVTCRIFDEENFPVPVSSRGARMVADTNQPRLYKYNLWNLVEDLLADPAHEADACWCYKSVVDSDGQRVFGEINTSTWWESQQTELTEATGDPEAKILAIIMYADETTVSANGRNVHPVYISLGNLT